LHVSAMFGCGSSLSRVFPFVTTPCVPLFTDALLRLGYRVRGTARSLKDEKRVAHLRGLVSNNPGLVPSSLPPQTNRPCRPRVRATPSNSSPPTCSTRSPGTLQCAARPTCFTSHLPSPSTIQRTRASSFAPPSTAPSTSYVQSLKLRRSPAESSSRRRQQQYTTAQARPGLASSLTTIGRT
jgi:hypothetical protein